MVQVLTSGGWMMVPLGLCSLVAFAFVIERGVYFHKLRAKSGSADRMLKLIQDGKFTDALAIAERNGSPLLHVLAAGIINRERDPDKAMEVESIAQLSAMKRGLPALDTIITLAPFLGLLGTVIGMIKAFDVIAAAAGLSQPQAIVGGVAEALITTAAGLAIAVVTVVPYNYFQSRIERETDHIEQYATKAELALHKGAE